MISAIGCALIGVLTAVLGYPAWSSTSGFSGKNTIILICLVLLWSSICYLIEKK